MSVCHPARHNAPGIALGAFLRAASTLGAALWYNHHEED